MLSLGAQSNYLMCTYFLYDGQNELGPFSLDALKQQKLKRNTPIRIEGSNQWTPAEKMDTLKEIVRPAKIRIPNDVVPFVTDTLHDWHQRKPLLLYGTAVMFVLLLSLSLSMAGRKPPQTQIAKKPVAQPAPATVAVTPRHTADTISAAGVKELPVVMKPVAAALAEEDKAKAARLQWRKTITASNSNYGIGVLGGIKGLEVVVHNNSDYMVDEAVAKVTYLKANGKEWKSVFVYTYGVRPHDSKSIPVTDVNRGKKVKVTLSKVVSRKMKLNYQEGHKIKDYADPNLAE